ncbi:hypothetical protein CXG81DRAFT_23478 [Caulochytrium protostelioides]|uniref:Conserved oligomeric Golgi complex subunit 3 n=1 Tax=Caulochytrium protostelioides TaxID=1555241 RepID=A0A4P9XFC9_9FUNG|nr:hypothetical protein CXG81DRAFT_23478 [Caulochytrium protostelioides]|eukprot:RKP03921.1 hypothetical protein CXG81DRAFT_23478 [Caulochytrium protostelioides]
MAGSSGRPSLAGLASPATAPPGAGAASTSGPGSAHLPTTSVGLFLGTAGAGTSTASSATAAAPPGHASSQAARAVALPANPIAEWEARYPLDAAQRDAVAALSALFPERPFAPVAPPLAAASSMRAAAPATGTATVDSDADGDAALSDVDTDPGAGAGAASAVATAKATAAATAAVGATDPDLDVLDARHPIATPQDFLAWYGHVASALEHAQARDARRWLQMTQAYHAQCVALAAQSADALARLDALAAAYDGVKHKTSAIQETCEASLAEQLDVTVAAEKLHQQLAYFQALDVVAAAMAQPGRAWITEPPFDRLLAQLDVCIAFMAAHPHYHDAPAYGARFRAHMTRALTLVKMNFVDGLRDVVRDVRAAAATTSAAAVLDPGVAYTLYYGKFASLARAVAPLLAQIARRVHRHDEYASLWSDCLHVYCNSRAQLIVPRIADELRAAEARVAAAATSAGTSKPLAPASGAASAAAAAAADLHHGPHLLALAREACTAVLTPVRDEARLFFQFFIETHVGDAPPASAPASASAVAMTTPTPDGASWRSRTADAGPRGGPGDALASPPSARALDADADADAAEGAVDIASMGLVELGTYMEVLGQPLVDLLRPLILREPRLEILSELAHTLTAFLSLEADAEAEAAHDGAPATATGAYAGLAPAAYAALQAALGQVLARIRADVQDRLIFRAQAFMRDEIERFRPTARELDVFARGHGLPKPFAKQFSSGAGGMASPLPPMTPLLPSTPSGFGFGFGGLGVPLYGGGEWYPALSRTLTLLTKLHVALPPAIFSDLAHDAILLCCTSIATAGRTLAAARGDAADGQLFQIKNLLVLREGLSAFGASGGFVREERDVDLGGLENVVATFFWGHNAAAAAADKGAAPGGLAGRGSFVAGWDTPAPDSVDVAADAAGTPLRTQHSSSASLPDPSTFMGPPAAGSAASARRAAAAALLPQVRKTSTDAAAVLDAVLKRTCERYIAAAVRACLAPVRTWMLQYHAVKPGRVRRRLRRAAPPEAGTAATDAEDDDTAMPVFASAAGIRETAAALRRVLPPAMATTRAQLGDYLDDQTTEQVILDVVSGQVRTALAAWRNAVAGLGYLGGPESLGLPSAADVEGWLAAAATPTTDSMTTSTPAPSAATPRLMAPPATRSPDPRQND